MLNGHTLNGAPLNGAPRRTVLGPVVVQPVVSVLWNVRVMLAGTDITDQLTGSVRIEREEGAATLADIVIALAAGPVNPSSYIGNTVEIYYQHWNGAGWDEHLRFRGQVVRPQYDLQGRLLSCECSDRLQDAVEALSVAQVDALCGGTWSADMYESAEGRSRWDYAQERMATRTATLQKSVEGVLQVTGWAAAAQAHWLVPAGAALDETLDYAPVELSERVNALEVSLEYRFQRLRQRHQRWLWEHPDIAGWTIDNSFCLWRSDSTELPDIPMITEAVTGAGYQAVLDGASWLRLPLSGVYCSPPQGWTNVYADLLLAADFTGARRWVQPVTEQYTLRLEATASIAQAGEVIRRDSVAAETENDRADEFIEAVFTAPEADATQDALGDWVVDLHDSARREQAFTTLAETARVQILSAHRGNRYSFELPTSDTLGMRLEHTLQSEDEVAGRQIRARGKLALLVDEFDFDQGTAITTLSLAISQGGGGVDDPLLMPAPPSTTPSGAVPALIILPTQLGSKNSSPIYDDELDGFAGNYDVNDLDINPALVAFPRRLDVTAPEIPEDHQDEFVGVRPATFRVAIPDDLLEL